MFGFGINLPYRTDIVQLVYFVIDSFEHLMHSAGEIEACLARYKEHVFV